MNYEIEEELLGNLLLSPDLIKKIVIPDECFLDITNRFIFKLFKKQYLEHKTINPVGIAENYKQLFTERFKLNEIILKITDMMNNAIPVSNIDYLQETIFSKFIEQNILKSIDLFKQQKISTEELLLTIHKYESMSVKSTDHTLDEEEIFQLINSNNKNINLKFTGISDVANIQEHDLVVIAARPGIGKTGFILNILEDISDKYNCLLFNMEMAEKQIYQRLVAINTNIPMSCHTNPETTYQENKIKEGCKRLASKKIKIITQGQTIESIRRKIINKSKNGHTVAFIDYVGLIGTVDKKSSLYEKITSIVKELRQISLDYDCTIFLVSQLNRSSEREKNKIPKISELKESGELEQSATTVIMLHDEHHDQNLSKKEIEMSIIIGKNRNGKLGLTKLNYNKETQKFSEIRNVYKEPNSWRKEKI